jgi:hypothetical protein
MRCSGSAVRAALVVAAALAACATADRRVVREQLALAPIPAGRDLDADLGECEGIAATARTTFMQSGEAKRIEGFDFSVLVARNCMANRGYALRACKRTFMRLVECEGAGLPE